MRCQPESVHAIGHGTYQQMMNMPAEKNSGKREIQCNQGEVAVLKGKGTECKGFVWMWLIKVYRCRRSAIYSLNLDPSADTARLQLDK